MGAASFCAGPLTAGVALLLPDTLSRVLRKSDAAPVKGDSAAATAATADGATAAAVTTADSAAAAARADGAATSNPGLSTAALLLAGEVGSAAAGNKAAGVGASPTPGSGGHRRLHKSLPHDALKLGAAGRSSAAATSFWEPATAAGWIQDKVERMFV